ncbi:uncharacterized protein [Cherax quadricarinatus]
MRAVWTPVLLSYLHFFSQCQSKSLVCQEINPREPVPLDLSPSKVRSDDALEVEFCLCPQDNIPSWILIFTFLRGGDTLATVRMYHKTKVNGQQSDVDTLQIQCNGLKPVETSNPWSYDQLSGIPQLFKLNVTQKRVSIVEENGGQEKEFSEVCLQDLNNITLTAGSDPCCGHPNVSLSCSSGVSPSMKYSDRMIIFLTVMVSIQLLTVLGVVCIAKRTKFTRSQETGQNGPSREATTLVLAQQRKPVPTPRTTFLQKQVTPIDSDTSAPSITYYTSSTLISMPATTPSVPASPMIIVGSTCTRPAMHLPTVSSDFHKLLGLATHSTAGTH